MESTLLPTVNSPDSKSSSSAHLSGPSRVQSDEDVLCGDEPMESTRIESPEMSSLTTVASELSFPCIRSTTVEETDLKSSSDDSEDEYEDGMNYLCTYVRTCIR
jgi:hypothetical protein